MISTSTSRPNQSLLPTVRHYAQLTKPRIILLLLITTASSMWIAAQGHVAPIQLLVTLVGGALAAAAANTLNCVYDRDIDYEMERTRHRPLPSGLVQPHRAVIFAIALAFLSFILLTIGANLLSALLAMTGIGFYVGIYTHLLKRHTAQNIVIGGAAGAIPPLVGWAAVTGDLSKTAWVLFALVCLWTPPHFWALALLLKDDYAQGGVPMLPVVAGNAGTARQILIYSLLLAPVTLLLVYPLHMMGMVYGAIALLLGAILIQKAWILMQAPEEQELARSLFKFSISYLMLLCAGMVVDTLL